VSRFFWLNLLDFKNKMKLQVTALLTGFFLLLAIEQGIFHNHSKPHQHKIFVQHKHTTDCCPTVLNCLGIHFFKYQEYILPNPLTLQKNQQIIQNIYIELLSNYIKKFYNNKSPRAPPFA
jgi:hypothetical protein